MRKINCPMRQKKRSMVLLPALVRQPILVFFSMMVGFSIVLPHQRQCEEHHNALLLCMDTLSLSTTHPTHVLLGAVCPFPHWVGYFPQSLMVHHLTSLHVILFMKAMSIIVHVVILLGIVAILTH